jgi:hypothetical protein
LRTGRRRGIQHIALIRHRTRIGTGTT